MASVSIADAETRLGELIARARAGEDVTILDGEQPVARIIAEQAPRKPFDLEEMRRIRALSKPYIDPDGLSFVERMRRDDEL
jgi:antitoxin (DNA-binding transcriptional repressor) of toxin-antitoxin stability system